MSAIAKRDNLYRKMYDLLIDFELKISELSRIAKQRKKVKKNIASMNDLNRLKLHRKLLKNSLKWLKSASKKQKNKHQSELQGTFKKAKKAFLKSNEAMS